MKEKKIERKKFSVEIQEIQEREKKFKKFKKEGKKYKKDIESQERK